MILVNKLKTRFPHGQGYNFMLIVKNIPRYVQYDEIQFCTFNIYWYVQNDVYNAIENRPVFALWTHFCNIVYVDEAKDNKKDLMFSHPPQEFFKFI